MQLLSCHWLCTKKSDNITVRIAGNSHRPGLWLAFVYSNTYSHVQILYCTVCIARLRLLTPIQDTIGLIHKWLRIVTYLSVDDPAPYGASFAHPLVRMSCQPLLPALESDVIFETDRWFLPPLVRLGLGLGSLPRQFPTEPKLLVILPRLWESLSCFKRQRLAFEFLKEHYRLLDSASITVHP